MQVSKREVPGRAGTRTGAGGRGRVRAVRRAIWLNTAHQGPLPRPAVEMAERAAALKAAPHRIGDDDFSDVPERLRALPASFATTLPWTASLELLLDADIDAVAAWDQRLVDRLVAGIDPERYRLVSPARGPARPTLVVLSAVGGDAAEWHRRLAAAGIDTAFREGNLRMSGHLFNGPEQIDQALAALHSEAVGSGYLWGRRDRWALWEHLACSRLTTAVISVTPFPGLPRLPGTPYGRNRAAGNTTVPVRPATYRGGHSP